MCVPNMTWHLESDKVALQWRLTLPDSGPAGGRNMFVSTAASFYPKAFQRAFKQPGNNYKPISAHQPTSSYPPRTVLLHSQQNHKGFTLQTYRSKL